jgi:hypothetical protein
MTQTVLPLRPQDTQMLWVHQHLWWKNTPCRFYGTSMKITMRNPWILEHKPTNSSGKLETFKIHSFWHTARYGLDLKYAPKSSCVKGSCSKVETFWRWLGHEDPDLMNGLTHLWIQSLIGYCEVVETLGGWALLEEAGHQACALGRYILSLTLSSLPLSAFWLPRNKQFYSSHVLPTLMSWFTTGPETMKLSDHGLKPLKLWTKRSLSYLSWLSQQQKDGVLGHRASSNCYQYFPVRWTLSRLRTSCSSRSCHLTFLLKIFIQKRSPSKCWWNSFQNFYRVRAAQAVNFNSNFSVPPDQPFISDQKHSFPSYQEGKFPLDTALS